MEVDDQGKEEEIIPHEQELEDNVFAIVDAVVCVDERHNCAHKNNDCTEQCQNLDHRAVGRIQRCHLVRRKNVADT